MKRVTPPSAKVGVDYATYYMRCGVTFRSGRTRPADAQSSDSETLSPIQSLAGYLIAIILKLLQSA